MPRGRRTFRLQFRNALAGGFGMPGRREAAQVMLVGINPADAFCPLPFLFVLQGLQARQGFVGAFPAREAGQVAVVGPHVVFYCVILPGRFLAGPQAEDILADFGVNSVERKGTVLPRNFSYTISKSP